MDINLLPAVGLSVDMLKKYMGKLYFLKPDGSLEIVHTIIDHLEEVVAGTSKYKSNVYIKAEDLDEMDLGTYSNRIISITVPSLDGGEISQSDKLLPSNILGGENLYRSYSEALYRYSGGKLSPLLHYSGDISELFDPSVRVRTFYVLKKLPAPVAERLATVHENDIIVLGDIPIYLEGGTVSPVSPTL